MEGSYYLHISSQMPEAYLTGIAISVLIPIMITLNKRWREYPPAKNVLTVMVGKWSKTAGNILAWCFLFLFSFLFIGLPVTLILNLGYTANVIIIEPDNRPVAKKVFIWNHDYGKLEGRGKYLVNRMDCPVVEIAWSKGWCPVVSTHSASSVGVDAGYSDPEYTPYASRTFAPGSVTRLEELPDTYCSAPEAIYPGPSYDSRFKERITLCSEPTLQKLIEDTGNRPEP